MLRVSPRLLRQAVRLAPAALIFSGICLATTGCANFNAAAPTATASGSMGGSVFGGRQPIAGATVQVYAAGQNGYGTGASLLATTTTNASGGFNFPAGTYACPSTSGTPTVSQTLYLTSTGGTPTTGIINPNAVLMAVLGNCSTVLANQPNVVMNEATTIAGIFAMQQFASISSSGGVNLGTSTTNVIGLQNAAATVNNLVTLSSGFPITSQTLTGAISGYTTAPTVTVTPETTKLNTLADILASCVNSAGSTSSTCQTLFNDVNATPATDTLQAAYYLATNPTSTVNGTSNLQALYNLVSAQSPYQAILTSAPNDWTLGITYGSNSSTTFGSNASATYLLYYPEYLGIDAGGNVWIGNARTSSATTAGNSVTELSPTGTPMNQVLTGVGQLAGIDSLILDPASNVWVSNFGATTALGNTVVEYNPNSNATSTFTTANAGPGPLASDGAGNIFVSTTGTYSATPTAGAADIEAIASTASSGSQATQLATNATAGRYSGLVVDGNETIYLSNQTTGTAQYQSTGGPLYLSNGVSTAGGQGPAAEGLTLAPGNNLYVGNYNSMAGAGTVSELSGANFMSGSGPFTAGSLAGVQKLLVDGLGNLWVTSYPSSAGTLSQFTAAGVPLSPLATGFAHNFKGALGLAIDRSGNVWVGNYGSSASATGQAYINEVVGAAGPTITPQAAQLPGTAGSSTFVGQRP